MDENFPADLLLFQTEPNETILTTQTAFPQKPHIAKQKYFLGEHRTTIKNIKQYFTTNFYVLFISFIYFNLVLKLAKEIYLQKC